MKNVEYSAQKPTRIISKINSTNPKKISSFIPNERTCNPEKTKK